MTGFISQTLDQLFLESKTPVYTPVPNLTITGVAFDSRAVHPGNVFIALVGANSDGHAYIPAAIERGAVAVVGTRVMENLPAPYIRVEDSRVALAWLSAAFYSHPARQLTVIGVTGTDGKTTTSNLIYQILLSACIPTGIISTVNATIGAEVVDTGFHVTTPEAPEIQRFMARMVAAGLTHVVLEATSHGLAQHRVLGCEFDVAVITNITHEHLDYHGTFEAYRNAKAALVTGLAQTSQKACGNPRTAVLNLDDSSYSFLKDLHQGRQISYSLGPGGTITAEQILYTPKGTRFTAHGNTFTIPIRTRLLGTYNISNCLAAIGATVGALGIPPEAARQGISNLPGVPGRMEPIEMGQDFSALVDFAHTPNALKRTLETAREMTRGKVIVILGSAGLRDRDKRFLMAGYAASLADLSIFTAEDPRTESLKDILAIMAEGAIRQGAVEGRSFWRIPDRREAIRYAIQKAHPGDLVIACGKGHEQSMCFGMIEYPWDDRQAMRAALAERLGLRSPGMPVLPDLNEI